MQEDFVRARIRQPADVFSNCRNRRYLAFVFTVCLVLCANALSQGPPWDYVRFEKIVKVVIGEWEVENSINLDPRVLDLVVGETGHFKEIFGYSYENSATRQELLEVTELLADIATIKRVVSNYLNNAATETSVPTVIDLLAREIGKSSKLAGWPEQIKNQFESIDFEDQLPDDNFTLISDGTRDGKSSIAKVFLVLPGNHVIQSDADAWEFTTKQDSVTTGNSNVTIDSTRATR